MDAVDDAVIGWLMTATLRSALYAALAVLGVVLTWKNNLRWMADAPADAMLLQQFWIDAFATHIAASLAWDILIAGTAGLILVIAETKRLGMAKWWPVAYFVLGNAIAAAFALPLFLFFRERHLARG